MKITIGHLYPDLLNLYGDRGNIQCMKKRCEWRGIEAEVREVSDRQMRSILRSWILVLLGGGSDREQMLVCEKLKDDTGGFSRLMWRTEAVSSRFAAAISFWAITMTRTMDGSRDSLWWICTPEQGSPRLISNIVIQNDECFPIPSWDLRTTGAERISMTTGRLGKVPVRLWK